MYTPINDIFEPATSFAELAQSPGQWFRVPDGSLHLCCPTCKVVVRIACLPHTVKPNGRVFPSWVCPQECGFHSMIALRGVTAANGDELACVTCGHQHGQACETCGCLAGTREGKPQPVLFTDPAFHPVIGVVRESALAVEQILLGIGAEEVVFIRLSPERAEIVAKNLIDQAALVRGRMFAGLPKVG